MGRVRQSHQQEVLPLIRLTRAACQSRSAGRAECRRFSIRNSSTWLGGTQRRRGPVPFAPLSAGHLTLVASAVCFVFLTQNVSCLTCNCKDSDDCDPNDGSCPRECAPGWFGAGCQVGNMAYRKTAVQSSTNAKFSAEIAVDGFTNQSSQTNNTLSPWWYVILSKNEDIVITNVTIIPVNGYRPTKVIILYTRDSSDSPPHPSNWTTFAFDDKITTNIEEIQPSSDKLAVGKRVAIYLNGTSSASLKLREVYVYGFFLTVLPGIFNVTWALDQTCDTINVTATSLNVINLWPSAILLYGNTTEGYEVMGRIEISNSALGFTFVVFATSNRSYQLWITPEICLSDVIGKQLASALKNGANCLQGVNTPVDIVQTSSRTYEAWTNGSCLIVSVRSAKACNLPIAIKGRCGIVSSSSNFTYDGVAKLCGFNNATNCQVNVTLSNNSTEVDVVRNILREPTAYIANWNATATCDYINVRIIDIPDGGDLHLISVFVNDSSMVQSTQKFMTNTDSRAMEFRIPVASNRSYAVWVSSLLCLTRCWNLDQGANCLSVPERNCITTARSNDVHVNTSSRVYEAWANNSCILVGARTPSQVSCDLPISLSAQCENFSTSSNFTDDGIAMLCGINNTRKCEVFVTLNNNRTEVIAAKDILRETTTYIEKWNVNTTCDYINVQLSDLPLSSALVFILSFVNNSGNVQNTQTFVTSNNSRIMRVSFSAAANRSYAVWVSRLLCLSNCLGTGKETNCSFLQEEQCITTAKSNVTYVKTKSRSYEALSNRSCVIVQAKADPLCETADPIMIQCGQFNTSEKRKLNGTTMLCGSLMDINNGCSVFVTTVDGRTQSNTIASSEVVPILADTLWNIKSGCDLISVSLSKISGKKPVYAVMRTVEDDIMNTILKNYTDISINGINESIPADPNTKLQIVIAQCVGNITCSTADRQQCTITESCLTYEVIKAVSAMTTEYRTYETSANASCVFASLSSKSSQECLPPTQLSISCSGAQDAIVTNDSTNASLCNLLPNKSYECIVTAIISSGHIETRSAKFSTDALSNIITPGQIPTTTLTAGQLAGAAIGSILISALIAGLIFFVLRRYNVGQKQDNGVLQCLCNGHSKNEETRAEAEELTLDDAEYTNLQGISLSEFSAYAQNDELVCQKYEKHVPRSSLLCDVGRDEKNKSKNKFQNIIPYDVNRVVLNGTNEYINASFINGYFKKRKYIATQGPTLHTIGDFWLMVWQQKVSTIVMLTDFVENAKRKCETYFPVACSGDSVVQVNIRSRKTFDCHVITVLDIKMSHETRTVTHHHMLAWKDHSIPDHCAQLLLFYSLISDLCQQSSSISLPTVVVHCSAGAGRTGTFIAFDWLLHCANVEERIDVDRCVKTLREQRMQSVQTKDQYLFLHKAVLYGLKTLNFTFNADFLNQYVNKLSTGTDSTSAIDDEWHVLNECRKNVRHLYEAANKPENLSKNRSNGVLPTDAKRLYLQQEGDSTCDYINAVYCNGCYCDKSFVVTQIPLQSTVNDFWTMVYEIQASCIVLMHPVPDEEDYAGYYPACGQSITVGRYEISNDSRSKEELYSDYKRFKLLVSIGSESGKTEEDELKVKLFVLSKWDIDEATPKDIGSILALMTELRPYCQDSSRRPVIVQCRDGARHSGLFVCAANALHRLIETNQVQVFHSVDLARSSRPEFIASKEQYLFIYRMLLQHHETSAVYANA